MDAYDYHHSGLAARDAYAEEIAERSEMPKAQLVRIIWPDERWVTSAQVIQWANDEIANTGAGTDENETVTDLDRAIEILTESGAVTFTGARRDASQ